MLVFHDDANRESVYGLAAGSPDAKVGRFTQALYDEANGEDPKSEARNSKQMGGIRNSKQIRMIEREENSKGLSDKCVLGGSPVLCFVHCSFRVSELFRTSGFELSLTARYGRNRWARG